MKHTTDIDMKNAHPVTLVYLCKLYGYACPEVQYYVNNREVILSQMPDRNEGKILYSKKFGLEFKKHCAINKFDNVVSKNKKIGGKVIKVWSGLRAFGSEVNEEDDITEPY